MQTTIFSIGTRKVRSAGRASGSIEITLPPELAVLEGMNCRIVLRDGARPEIVLEPDLTPAVAIFARAWSRLRTLLRLAGDIGDFPAQECELALLPGSRQNGRPLLIYSHAWQVSLGRRATSPEQMTGRNAALAGLIAPLATIAGQRLGLVGMRAVVFGAALAGLVAPAGSRETAGPADFESGATRRIWCEMCGASTLPLDAFEMQSQDAQAQQALQRIVSQFRAWQEHPDRHALARAQWADMASITFAEDQRS